MPVPTYILHMYSAGTALFNLAPPPWGRSAATNSIPVAAAGTK